MASTLTKTQKNKKTKTKNEGKHTLPSALYQTWYILLPRERMTLLAVIFMMVSYAVIQMISISTVMPFLAVASNPQVIETNRYLNWAYTTLGFETHRSFLMALGLGVAAFIVFDSLFKFLFKVAKQRWVLMRTYSLSTRLLAKYLSQPYVFFLDKNSADLSKNFLSEINKLITSFIFPVLDFTTKVLQAVGIVVLLVVVQPQVAAVVAGGFAVIYGGIYGLLRRLLYKWGRKQLALRTVRFQTGFESMSGVKDVKLLGKERQFVERYAKPTLKSKKIAFKVAVVGKIPRYLMRTFINGGIVLGVTLLMVFSDNFTAWIPIIGVYAVASSRLLPVTKTLFKDVAKIRSHQPVVEMVFEHMQAPTRPLPDKRATQLEPLPFERDIRLQDIRYRYPETEQPVIENLNLTIKKNTTVGFVGPTGCGKTTLIDLILGLLWPEAGRILIDDRPLTEDNVRNWQGQLGYVPQSIYLTDDTVARNIAFGIPDHEVDMDAVRHAAEVANLNEVIEREMPYGYDTVVGDRGVRLSGGQRQRLGIARALYHDPQVLVMDEATSALDGVTESAIMEAIEKLTGSKTIVLIAHRLATLMDCNHIYMLESGRIVDHGTYHELMARSSRFQEMARVGE